MVKEVLKVSPETGGAYEAPKCEVMELQMEGVLCASSDTGHEGGGGQDVDFPWTTGKQRERER